MQGGGEENGWGVLAEEEGAEGKMRVGGVTLRKEESVRREVMLEREAVCAADVGQSSSWGGRLAVALEMENACWVRPHIQHPVPHSRQPARGQVQRGGGRGKNRPSSPPQQLG